MSKNAVAVPVVFQDGLADNRVTVKVPRGDCPQKAIDAACEKTGRKAASYASWKVRVNQVSVMKDRYPLFGNETVVVSER